MTESEYTGGVLMAIWGNDKLKAQCQRITSAAVIVPAGSQTNPPAAQTQAVPGYFLNEGEKNPEN